MQDFIVEIDGRRFVDIVKVLPRKFDNGKKVIYKNLPNNTIEIYIKKAPGKAGHDSKKFVLYRFIELDDLFFEGLGLWEGEGGKDKGLYFGNSCLELLLHFLKFVEQKLGLLRNGFKVTVNSPNLNEQEDTINKRWSEKLKIPFENFTHVCYDSRINREYAQIYINGIVLTELMLNLHEKFKELISENREFSVPYLRGLMAGEGSVLLKSWGTLSHVDISSGDKDFIEFVKDCLFSLAIISGDYVENGKKIQIYGKTNFKKFKELNLHTLHPDKLKKFERGFSNYRRDVKKRYEMIYLILSELIKGAKTYDELAMTLNKGRSTIQSHYIPILEKEKLVKRIGKKCRSLLFVITSEGMEFLGLSRIEKL